jgi:hypothetical protein
VIDDAMERFMPKYTSDATARCRGRRVGAREVRSRSRCASSAASRDESQPVSCGVCGGPSSRHHARDDRQDRRRRGRADRRTTYDGHKLKWTEESKKALWTMKDAYQRRRTKARVEKSARLKKLPVITLEFAKKVIEDETGAP